MICKTFIHGSNVDTAFKGCGIKKLCLVKWNWVLQDVTEQLTIHC